MHLAVAPARAMVTPSFLVVAETLAITRNRVSNRRSSCAGSASRACAAYVFHADITQTQTRT